MSELPSYKQVRRSDLTSDIFSDESDNPDPEIEARYREQLKQSYQHFEEDQGIDEDGLGAPHALEVEQARDENKNEMIYEFRLFGKTSNPEPSHESNHSLQKIALRSPTPQGGGSGFLKPQRPGAYYFQGTPSPELSDQYRVAAVSSADVLECQRMTWGLALPWRVTVINQKNPAKANRFQQLPSSDSSGRKRSGKKRRIAIRKKFATLSATQSAARQSKAEKEAAEKEKRTRRNREKKVKKKQKEKMMKSMPD